MTMNNLIPYKKPIIKQNPIAVNAKEVIREIEIKHNGLYSLSQQGLDEFDSNKSKGKRIRPKTGKPQIYKSPRMQKFLDTDFISSNMSTKRLRAQSAFRTRSIFTNLELVQNVRV